MNASQKATDMKKGIDVIRTSEYISEYSKKLAFLYKCLENTTDLARAQLLVREINNVSIKIEFNKTLRNGPKNLPIVLETCLPRRNVYDNRAR